METKRISIHVTKVSVQARPRDKKTVEALAGSMNTIGLLNPITVVPASYTEGGRADNPGFRVVAGGHRFEAAKMLGWTEIDAIVVDAQDDYRRQRMIEISENLHRAELSALERGKLVKEWKELVEERKDFSDKLSEKSKGRPEGGASKAARELGLHEKDVQRSVKIASLSPEAQAVAVETGLDKNQSALLEAAKHTEPEQQVSALKKKAIYLGEKQARQKTPAALPSVEAVEKQAAAVIKAWNKCGEDARDLVAQEIGAEIMELMG